jgi:transcriptional regulator with XRE-family HTH domain
MAGTSRYGGIPKARREQTDMTQEILAAMVGCSVTMIRLVESGYRPSEPYRLRIAHELGCDQDDLWPEDWGGLTRRAVQGVFCPRCEAEPGEPCTRENGEPRRSNHIARVERARSEG